MSTSILHEWRRLADQQLKRGDETADPLARALFNACSYIEGLEIQVMVLREDLERKDPQ